MGPLFHPGSVRSATLFFLLAGSAWAQYPLNETETNEQESTEAAVAASVEETATPEASAGLAGRIGSHAGRGFTTLVRDHALLWSSPVRERNWRIALPFIAATGLALSLDHPIVSRLPNTPDQIRYSKYVSGAGTYYTLGAAAGAFIAAGAAAGDRRAVETGLLAAQAITHTESIAQMLKFAGGRERPDFNEGSPGRFWHGQQSFPSGHAMGTWAVATIVSREYHQNRFIRYGVYAFPIAISASRMGAQRHFLSDVVAGGSLGYLIGTWLYNRHHDPALGGAAVRRGGISIRPDVQFNPKSGTFGIAVYLSR